MHARHVSNEINCRGFFYKPKRFALVKGTNTRQIVLDLVTAKPLKRTAKFDPCLQSVVFALFQALGGDA